MIRFKKMSDAHLAAVLSDSARAGVYRLPPKAIADLCAAARACELAWFRIDLADVRDKRDFLEVLSRGLQFPAWFGQNWDALDDCLTDMSWHRGKGFVVILDHCDALRHAAPLDFATALDILAAAAETWREDGVPFWTLVESAAGALPDLT